MSIRRHARALLVAGAAIALAGAMSGAAHADNVFLKADFAPGEATQRGFEGQSELTGASVSVSSFFTPDVEGLGDTTRTLNVGPIMLTKSPDRASPKLMMAAVNGDPLGNVEITFTSPGRAGQPPVVESKWIISGAEVRSYNVYPGVNPGDKPVETIEIGYASMRYQHFGKGGRGGTMEEVQITVPDDQLFPFDGGC